VSASTTVIKICPIVELLELLPRTDITYLELECDRVGSGYPAAFLDIQRLVDVEIPAEIGI